MLLPAVPFALQHVAMCSDSKPAAQRTWPPKHVSTAGDDTAQPEPTRVSLKFGLHAQAEELHHERQ